MKLKKDLGKIIPLFIVASAVILVGWLIFQMENSAVGTQRTPTDTNEVLKESSIEGKTLLAVCPTFYQILMDQISNKYYLIQTLSSAQSLQELLLANVNAAVIGRDLLPEENVYTCHEIADYESYSFLSNQELTVDLNQLANLTVRSDLDSVDLNQYLKIGRIEFVEDIYDFVDEGVVITSWENTDYDRASVVHVLNLDGTRYIRSRKPRVCCLGECPSDYIEDLEAITYLEEKDSL